MARARLHMICGNCGCNDEFEFEIDEKGQDFGEDGFKPEVFIRCKNCTTLHALTDNAELEESYEILPIKA